MQALEDIIYHDGGCLFHRHRLRSSRFSVGDGRWFRCDGPHLFPLRFHAPLCPDASLSSLRHADEEGLGNFGERTLWRVLDLSDVSDLPLYA